MQLKVKPTGNMTLSILNEQETQMLKLDMLRGKTMEAGLGGDRLALALNNLVLIAETINSGCADAENLPHPEAGFSPLPWVVEYKEEKRELCIKDADRRLIGDRCFPKGWDAQCVAVVSAAFDGAIRIINSLPPVRRDA